MCEHTVTKKGNFVIHLNIKITCFKYVLNVLETTFACEYPGLGKLHVMKI